MLEDFPTFAEVGEENIRERNKRLGLRYHVLGTPMELIDVEEDAAPAGGGRGS